MKENESVKQLCLGEVFIVSPAVAVEAELKTVMIKDLLLALRLDSPHFCFILYPGIPTKRICSIEKFNPSCFYFTALRRICPLLNPERTVLVLYQDD